MEVLLTLLCFNATDYSMLLAAHQQYLKENSMVAYECVMEGTDPTYQGTKRFHFSGPFGQALRIDRDYAASDPVYKRFPPTIVYGYNTLYSFFLVNRGQKYVVYNQESGPSFGKVKICGEIDMGLLVPVKLRGRTIQEWANEPGFTISKISDRQYKVAYVNRSISTSDESVSFQGQFQVNDQHLISSWKLRVTFRYDDLSVKERDTVLTVDYASLAGRLVPHVPQRIEEIFEAGVGFPKVNRRVCRIDVASMTKVTEDRSVLSYYGLPEPPWLTPATPEPAGVPWTLYGVAVGFGLLIVCILLSRRKAAA